MENPLLSPPPPLPYFYPPQQPPFILPSGSILCLRLRLRRRRSPSRLLLPLSFLLSLFLLLPLLTFLLFPSSPRLTVTHLHLARLHVSPPPRASFDLTLTVNTTVRNPNFFALDYSSLNSSVSYRGKRLGEVEAARGAVRARGESEAEAEVEIDGVRVLDEVVVLIEDLAKGSVPLVTVTEVEGVIGLFFFRIPVKGKISCSLNVNPKTQKIIRQDCYPE